MKGLFSAGSDKRQNQHQKSTLYSPHLWVIITIFLLVTAHHYAGDIGIFPFSAPGQLPDFARHTGDRLLYLALILYSGFNFRFRGGVTMSSLALVAMLPRAIFISPNTGDAVFESLLVTGVGTGASIWLKSQRQHKEQLEAAVARIETAQRKLQAQVRATMEQERKLSIVAAFSAMLSQSLKIRQVMKTAINMVMEIMRVEIVLIFSLDVSRKELRVTAFEGVPQKFVAAVDRIKLGEGLNGRVAETGQPLVVEDASTDPRLTRPAVKDEKLQAQLIVPLVSRGQIIGTLCVATRSPRQFNATEIELLTTIGNQIGIAMENSRLYQEQKSVTEQLRLSEEKYRQLFESANDAIWIQGLDGKIMAINEAGSRLVGYDSDEMVNRDVREFLSQDGLALAREIRAKLLRGETIEQPYEQRLTKKDGSEAILKLTTNLLVSNGQPSGFQHIARDITAEKHMQENLHFYVQQVTRAQEEERKRISRELHDSTAQTLIAMLHELESFSQEKAQLPLRDSRFLWNLRERLKDVLQEIRQFGRDLRPSILDDLGLLPAVEWLTEELKRESNMEVNFTVSGSERRFSPETEVILFRIIQEGLRNIAKHAEATKVNVKIEFRDTETVVTIADNGRGFELPGTIGEFARLGKLGLVGLQERALLLGANLDIQSKPGKGTTLSITIPAESL